MDCLIKVNIAYPWVRALSLSQGWLCSPMDCSLPTSSVREVFQARILKWVATSSSRGSYWSRDRTWVSCIGRRILYRMSHQGSPYLLYQRATRYFSLAQNFALEEGPKSLAGSLPSFSIFISWSLLRQGSTALIDLNVPWTCTSWNLAPNACSLFAL